MLGGFEVEKVTIEDPREFLQYRLKLMVGNKVLSSDCTVSANSPTTVDMAISNAIENILQLVRGDLVNSLRELKARTGDYDTTAYFHPPATSLQPIWDEYARQQTALQSQYNESLSAMMARQEATVPFNTIASTFSQLHNQQRQMRINPIGDYDYGIPKADNKAMKLLAKKIGFRKMRQLKKKGYWEEKGNAGTFKFHMDKQGGVTLVQTHKLGGKDRTIEWGLCVQSQSTELPKGDVILSRWLEWRADEENFLKTANFRNVHTRDEATADAV